MPGGRIEIEVVADTSKIPGQLASGLKGAAGIASTLGKGLGVAIASGAAIAAVGLKNVLDVGIEYQANLNELQAVTGATGVAMAKVGDVAKTLGSDLTLPGTSAADAASAMKELAKGGLDVDEAMTAAKGTLQLAAAAQIDAAAAAGIQSDALNQFGLAADQAGHVADVLANTANAASGEITDMAGALKYVGPVARAMGVDIDSTATAIGLLAQQGIRGEQAGTSLRGILASLSDPSKEAAKALEVLGVNAFTAEGKFVGLRTITEQLSAAKGKLTDAEFAAAAAAAFGNEGLTTANALALSGTEAFDSMATAVTKAGGAAEVSAAKTKGLGGAWDGLKSQLETTGIGIFEAIDGPLEKLVRSGAEKIDTFGKVVVDGLNTAVSAGELYGPRLASAITSRGAVIGTAVRQVLGPIASGAVNPLNEAVNRGIGLWEDFTGVIKNVVEGAKPVAQGIQALGKAAADGDGPVSALGAGVGVLGTAVKVASGILVPIGQLVGGIVSAFAALPGPIQSAALAFVAFKVASNVFSDTKLFSGVRQFSDEMAVQRSLATANGEAVGRLGSGMAAFNTSTVPAVASARAFRDQTVAIKDGAAAAGQPISTMSAALGTLVERSPALSGMRAAFQDASQGVERFGTAAGIAAAAGSGLKSLGSGLVSALGGPFGAALVVASVGLSLLADSQQKAAQATAAHKANSQNLASALREANGAITENVRLTAAQNFLGTDQYKDAVEAARSLGISMGDITNASLRQGNSMDSLKTKLEGIVKANTSYTNTGKSGTIPTINDTGKAAQTLLSALDGLGGEYDKAIQDNKDLEIALNGGHGSMLKASESGRTLSDAMAILSNKTATADEKTRALKDAMDALSGGNVNLEAAQSRLNAQLDRLGDAFGENVDKTKGWGDALLNANGSINTTLPNGRLLFDSLQDIGTEAGSVALKTFEVARANNEDIPTAMAKAAGSIQTTRDALVAQGEKWGFNRDQINAVLDRYGLIPEEIATRIAQPNMTEAQIELLLLKKKVEDVPGLKEIHVESLSDAAQAKLEAVGFTVERVPGGKDIIITANDGDFNSKIAAATAPATKTITIQYYDTGVPIAPRGSAQAAFNAKGNILTAMAAGGLLKSDAFGSLGSALTGGVAQAFASGGFHKLTPMKGGVAQIVPPNTWRIVGDRLRDDEAYIPINQSQRSQALLQETAARMGYHIRQYALGGIAAGRASAPVAGGDQYHFAIDARGATVGAVRALEQSTIPKLRMMLAQGVGKKGR
ncbi:phage tail tape measure protein [Umezawaea sp. Da 62-37]|uniref:phage tail tape measure protein n=1 Tax=Umezawaea sp. Da 62-37 TaxID=3075927 RepID=UPI0028F72405|nr:phage tail tape measure protein [Umezawaea sp. Da 62-37]WNV89024.1 phage tail tape measure protein [Umezawaea sp. Da 62-37]